MQQIRILLLLLALTTIASADERRSTLVVNVVDHAGWVSARYNDHSYILIIDEAGGWSSNTQVSRAWNGIPRNVPIIYVWARPRTPSRNSPFFQNLVQQYWGANGFPLCAVVSDRRVVYRGSGFEACTLQMADHINNR